MVKTLRQYYSQINCQAVRSGVSQQIDSGDGRLSDHVWELFILRLNTDSVALNFDGVLSLLILH